MMSRKVRIAALPGTVVVVIAAFVVVSGGSSEMASRTGGHASPYVAFSLPATGRGDHLIELEHRGEQLANLEVR